MQRRAATLIVIALVVCASVLLAGVAATVALARPDSATLNADLGSALRADYSADEGGTQLAPLSEEIIDATRRDSEALDPGDTLLELHVTRHLLWKLYFTYTDHGVESFWGRTETLVYRLTVGARRGAQRAI